MTKQISDILIFENKKYYLGQELLELFFMENPDLKPDVEEFCTALWRGYIASFEILNHELVIQKLENFDGKEIHQNKYDKVLPIGRKFEWFSGLIRIDEDAGEFCDEKPNMTFIYLEIYKGDYLQTRTFNFEEHQDFKKEQFAYFKQTEFYRNAYNRWLSNNPEMDETKIDEYIYPNLLTNYPQKIFDNPFE